MVWHDHQKAKMMMLTSLVLLLVIVQLVSGQCPNIAASFGDDLNLSSFSLSLHAYDASEGVGEYSGASVTHSICDWICKNRPNCHNSGNPVYCLTL